MSRTILKNPVGIIEMANVTILATQLSALQNQMMIKFCKLDVNQPQSQVNLVQQTLSRCEIYGINGHFANSYRTNLESVNFIRIAWKGSLDYGNAYNHKWQSQPNYSQGNHLTPTQQFHQQQNMHDNINKEKFKNILE